ncbi:VOC family protein [Streptomyces gamaensis]|uniref:VOC family protein n=1 Tax=Streptomyces gamaensis TaxID=1763542 RepID=A0ABW0YWX3_9ACTN
MITTDYVPGSPCWLDLGAPDVPAAVRFYSAVFDWDFQSMAPHAPDHGIFQVDGKAAAGLGPLTEEGARSAWMIYFRTDDVDATDAAVRQGGGTVRVPPRDAGERGRMAQYTDPQGGQFAVFQPRAYAGLEAVDEPGALCWTELYTTDAAAAKRFYGSVFGWATEDIPLPGDDGMTYTLLAPSGLGQERRHGGLMQLAPEQLPVTDGRAYWHPVFASADCDVTVHKVTGGGGAVQMGPVDVEGVGRLAVCTDLAGADFVALTPSD